MSGIKPFTAVDFIRVQMEWALGVGAINPDMFLVGFHARRQFEQAFRWAGQSQPEFFMNFADGAGIVIFPSIQMTRSRRIPYTRLPILFHRSLLQKNLSSGIEDENVNRAMLQSQPVNFGSSFGTDHFIPVVYDIKNFLTHRAWILNRAASREKQEPP